MLQKVFIKTYGCQMNVADSEKILSILSEIGYCPEGKEELADVIILNTCCIRNSAEEKVYGKIGDLRKLKIKKPNLILGVCGCVAEKEKENLLKRFPWVDFFLGPNAIEEIPSKILNIKKTINGEKFVLPPKLKTFVSIISGCNEFCSFCIVPYVRGREKSRKKEEILQEIKGLKDLGYKEITLIGQNVLAYGKDLEERKQRFGKLLEEVHKIDGVQRIRFITSHPKYMSLEIIDKIKELPKVCEYFHLPIQAGDDEILKKMNRKYTVAYYKELINKIREKIPKASITTDIIVGFPGETEEQYENTLKLVEEIRFDSAFTFMYSTRSGTKAAEMPEQLPLNLKKERLLKLNQIVQKISYEKNQELVGQEIEVLVEENNGSKLLGRTRTNKIVIFDGEKKLMGNFINVKIASAKSWTLEGVLT